METHKNMVISLYNIPLIDGITETTKPKSGLPKQKERATVHAGLVYQSFQPPALMLQASILWLSMESKLNICDIVTKHIQS